MMMKPAPGPTSEYMFIRDCSDGDISISSLFIKAHQQWKQNLSTWTFEPNIYR